MGHRVFGAFAGAGLTYSGAQGTHGVHMLATPSDGGRRETANIRALHRKRNAARHCRHITLAKAFGRTLQTRNNAFIASANAL